MLNGGGNLAGKPPVAKRGGGFQRRLFVASSLSLPVGGVEPTLQTPQDFGFRVFGGCVGLSHLDGVVSDLLLAA